eukprot:scaffold1027_cov413-Prasinococcus_capsulatus_cf.AAC.1
MTLQSISGHLSSQTCCRGTVGALSSRTTTTTYHASRDSASSSSAPWAAYASGPRPKRSPSFKYLPVPLYWTQATHTKGASRALSSPHARRSAPPPGQAWWPRGSGREHLSAGRLEGEGEDLWSRASSEPRRAMRPKAKTSRLQAASADAAPAGPPYEIPAPAVFDACVERSGAKGAGAGAGARGGGPPAPAGAQQPS